MVVSKRTKEPDTYYYKGSPVFPGMFAKKSWLHCILVSRVVGKTYASQSALLSTFTGKKVPVKVNETISRKDIDNMIEYIEDVSKRDWVEGRKYFYGLKSNDDWSFKYDIKCDHFYFFRFVILRGHTDFQSIKE